MIDSTALPFVCIFVIDLRSNKTECDDEIVVFVQVYKMQPRESVIFEVGYPLLRPNYLITNMLHIVVRY